MLFHATRTATQRVAWRVSAASGLLLLLGATSVGLAAEGETALARRMLQTGKYAEAAEVYARLSADSVQAVLGCARSHWAVGKWDEAGRVLSAADGEHADIEAELARMALERGNHEAAQTHCQRALSLEPNQLLARWLRGELFRLAGQIDEAEKTYTGLITYYGDHDVFTPDELRWIGRGAARYAEWNRLHDQFQFLVNEFHPDILKAEPGYWQAHYEAGQLLLAKYNRADAAKQFKAALELNPNAAVVHVALARLAMIDHCFDEAQAAADRALEINPRLQSAWLAKADLALANFDLPGAIEILENRARPLNPVSEQMLGRLAAGYILRDGPSENERHGRVDKIIDEASARNRHAGEFFFTLGQWLDTRHKAAAERFYKEAVAKLPRQVGPTAHLGLLYMHSGREGDARRALERAFAIDPFNARVKNMLEVLDLTDSMQTHDAGPCILKYDGRRDRILVEYAAPYVSEVYAELCELFGYRPAQKPLVEIFNRAKGVGGHQWFGARMTGLPYVGTIAASTGRIVAMVSPGEPALKTGFNWARVLKHELVHVITLQQTDFNIPRWFTEGLAVWCEQTPQPQAWRELLVRRVGKKELFDLESIDFAFTRPDSSDDWAMAYCQADLYVEFMLRDREPEVLLELLEAYAQNLSTPEAFQRVWGLSTEEFQREYVAYLEEVVDGLADLDAVEEGHSVAQLSVAHRKQPENVDTTARLALAYLRRGADQEALDMATEALELDGRHQLTSYVLGRLFIRAGQPDRAVSLLEGRLDRRHPEPRVLNLLAGLKLKARKYRQAAELYRLGESRYPNNIKWTRALARVYLLSGDERELASVLERIAEANPDDLVTRKKLIEISSERGDLDSITKWASQAIRIDTNDPQVHMAFAEAALGSHNQGLAAAELEVAVELDPEQPSWRLRLANTYVGLGRPEEARRVLWALLSLEPASPRGQSMLETLESEKRDAEQNHRPE